MPQNAAFMLKRRNQLPLLCCLLFSLLFSNLSAQDTICANRAVTDIPFLCIGCTATDPDNALNCDMNTVTSVSASLLGLGGFTYDLYFDGFSGVPGDTIEIFVANTDNNSLTGTTINSFGTDGTGELQQNGDIRSLNQNSINLSNGFIKIQFVPEAIFNGVRLTVDAAQGNGLSTVAFDLAQLYVIRNRVVDFVPRCEIADVQTTAIGGACTEAQCSVQNPDAILTEDEDDFATLVVGPTLAGGSSEITGFWNVDACDQDSVRIVLASNSLTGTVTINALQKINPGDAGTVVATLNVPALGTQRGEFYLFPQSAFNAVQIVLEAEVPNAAETSIRVHALCMSRIVPPRPADNNRNILACFRDTAVLNVEPYGVEVASWYTQRTGGTPIFTGNRFVTGELDRDTTFYYEGFIPGSNGCISSFRDSFNIFVFPATPPATGVVGTLVGCYNEPFTISPLPEGNIFTFYTANDTTELSTGTSYTIPTLLARDSILIQNTINGSCGSDSLVKATVLLYQEPVQAYVVPEDTIGICLDAANQPMDPLVKISVQDENPTGFNTTYRVYDGNMQLITVGGGQPAEFVFPNDSVMIPVSLFNIGAVGAIDSIFVDAVSGPCYESGSKKKIILVGVTPTTQNPMVEDVYACENESATLSVTNVDPQLYYYWFDAAVGGNLLYIGETIEVPAAPGIRTLYVEGNYGVVGSTCKTPGRDTVTVTPFPAINSPLEDLDVITCVDSVAVFDLTNIDLEGSVYSWYTQPTGGFPIFTGDSFVTPAAMQKDTYYLEVSNAECQDRFVLTVDTISPPQVNIENALRYACDEDEVMLTATSNTEDVIFSWYDNPVNGAGVLLSTDNPFAYTLPTGVTQQFLYARAQLDQCMSNSSALVIVENITSRQVPVAAPVDTTVCEGQSVTFRIQPQLNSELVSYSWWDAAVGGNRLSTTETYSSPGLNNNTSFYPQLELIDKKVCLSRGRDTVSAIIVRKLEAPQLNRDCVADNNSVTYSWPAVAGAVEYDYIVSITSNGSTQQIPGTTTNLTYTQSGLDPNSIVEFNIRALGDLACQTSEYAFKSCVSNECGLENLAAEQPFYQECEGQSVVIGVTGVPNDATVRLLSGGQVVNVGNQTHRATVTTVDVAGNFEITQRDTFEVTIPGVQGCPPVLIPIIIQVQPTPEGDITVVALDPAVIGGRIDEFQFIANFTGGDKTWNWDFGDGQTSTEKNPIHKYDNDGFYTVTLLVNQLGSNEFVCPASAQLQVVVSSIPDLFVPNTFTPGNGDNANDTWRVFGRNLVTDNYQVRIFNSYGNVVFESNDLNEAWDGTFEGEPAKMGSYYYTVVVYDAIGQRLEREGTLNLIRK